MKLKSYALAIYESRYGRCSLHVLFWLLFFGTRLYMNQISLNPYNSYTKGIVLSSLTSTLSTAFAYYLLVYVLYERFYRRKKYVATILGAIVLIIAYAALDFLFEKLLLQDKEWSRLVQANAPEYFRYLQQPFLGIMLSRVLSLGIVYALVINTLIPLFIRIMIAYNREQLQTMELARQNVQLEFNFLKSQVNPHFLHNTLNNIYSLIIHDKKTEAAGTVARLSAFMRYSMNDAGTENMPAAREVQLMQDYIELERIRLNYATVQAQFEMDDTVYTLPPLLLIPVIENAFKYSTDQKDAVISINFVINKKRLSFDCQNNFDPDVTTHLQHGIGIANVKKRLDQYYAQGYSYTETTVNNVYSVNISIDLL